MQKTPRAIAGVVLALFLLGLIGCGSSMKKVSGKYVTDDPDEYLIREKTGKFSQGEAKSTSIVFLKERKERQELWQICIRRLCLCCGLGWRFANNQAVVIKQGLMISLIE